MTGEPDATPMSRKDQEEADLRSYSCPDHILGDHSGVLLSDQIEACVKKFQLIDPFRLTHLRAAAYELSIGDEYALRGKIHRLCDEAGKDSFKLEPFDVAVIWIYERLNLPRNMIARWNIKVSLAYKGLVWVGGPQVDPGWVGHLSCPIYNLSDQPVELKLFQPIAVMDFVLTTPYRSGISKPYARPPKRTIFQDYEPEKLKSALLTNVASRIDQMEQRLPAFESRLEQRLNVFESRLSTFIGVTYTSIGILVAALSIFVSSAAGAKQAFPVWTYLSTGLSIAALAVAIIAFHRGPVPRIKRNAEILRFILMAGGFLAGAIATLIVVALWHLL